MGRAIVRGKSRTGGAKRNSHLAELQRVERGDSLRSLGFIDYRAYLRSELWERIRSEVLAASPNCKRCGEPAVNVHHSSYDRATMAGEMRIHLHALCGRCHKASGHCRGIARIPRVLDEKGRAKLKRLRSGKVKKKKGWRAKSGYGKPFSR